MKKETTITRISKKISPLILLLVFSNILLGQNNNLIIPPACPPPSDAGPDKYICPVGGSVQIGSAPTFGVTYKWDPINGLNDPNISNPTASPSTTTTYTLHSIGMNLFGNNGNFESGNTGFTSDYNYYSGAMNPGTIVVGANPFNYYNLWCNQTNHTPGGNNMLIVNGDLDGTGYFYKTTVSVLQNTTYTLGFFLCILIFTVT